MLRRVAITAEQDLLLVRLAADSGARRGEIAVLRYSDLDGRVLTIARGLSQGAPGLTKSSRARRLTLGATTTDMLTPTSRPGSDWASRPYLTGSSPLPRFEGPTFLPMPCRTSSAASGGRHGPVLPVLDGWAVAPKLAVALDLAQDRARGRETLTGWDDPDAVWR